MFSFIRLLKCLSGTCLSSLMIVTVVIAQTGPVGVITGHVYDAVTQEPLPGAAVSIDGSAIGTVTGDDGVFTLKNIKPGTYRIRAALLGYTPRVITDVVVGSGRQNHISIPLQPTTVDLKTVVVEADYFRRDNDAQVSTQSLSYEEIRRAPGGQEDVLRAIAVLPGVVQVSAGRNDLIVRGGAASENLYIVDGLEVPNINHFGTQGATGGPLSFINLDFVDDVSFSTGGFGARYGDKLSSVLNINLRDGRRDRFGGKLTISASQFGINTEGPVGNDASFLFSARRSYLDFIFKAAGFGFVPEYWDFLGKASWDIDQRNKLSFVVIGALDDVRYFNDTEDKRYSNSRVLGSSQNQYVSSVSLRRLMGTGYLSFSLGRSYTTYDYLQSDSLLTPIFRSKSNEGETTIRADAVFAIGRSTELTFGAAGKIGQNDGDLRVDTTSVYHTTAPFSTSWDTTSYKANAYIQLSTLFLDRLHVTLGGRMDYFSMIDHPVAFSPRAALSYSITPVTSATISGGVYLQAPSTIWLLSNPVNKRLDFVRVNQIVLGLEHLFQADTKVRVEGYFKWYRDYPASESRTYLVLANTGAGYGGASEGFASFGFDPLTSGGTGVSRGIELLVQKRLSDIPCYGIFSLSWNRTDFKALDGIERPGAYDQRIIGSLSGGYRLNERWEFSMKFRIASGGPTTPFLSNGMRDYSRYNSERLPVFHSLDIRVDRRWNFDSWNLIAYIDIQNVYNRKNMQADRWDTRNSRVENFSSSIGILPTIGVCAEM
jgi:hypothetical protein